jgi:hypothetical protein
MSERPARILFVLLHNGYLRHYAQPIAELARRGHHVHVSPVRGEEKHPGDDRLLERLVAEHPTVTTSVAPVRPYDDGWRRLAFFVRALIDVARYADPDYAEAHALRDRIIGHTTLRVDMTRLPAPLKRLFRAQVARLARQSTRAAAARRIARLQAVEDAIPASPEITDFVRDLAPDLVVATPVVEFASSQVEYLKSARALGVRTGVCIASWDNLTNKGLIRFRPNRVLVWNDIQRDEAERYHAVPRDRSIATGAPRFDPWFERRPSTGYAEFARARGLDPSRPYLLYLCSSPFIAPEEVPFVRRWLAAVRDRLPGIGVLVRPHPQNAAQWADVELGDAGAAVWPTGGIHPDEGEAQAGYFDSLAHCAAVVGLNTSALIEAGIAGKSVFTVLAPEFAGTQEGTLHFHYLRAEQGGFVHTARTLEEHAAQLADALEAPPGTEQTLAFVRSFVRPRGLDRTAASVLAGELAGLALADEPTVDERAAGSGLLRVLLTPVALAMHGAARVLQAAASSKVGA